MRKAIAPGEILKDKRVLIAGAGVGVLAAGAAAFYFFGQQQPAVDDTAPVVATQPAPTGGPGSPNSPGSAGGPPAGGRAPGQGRPKPTPSPAAALALNQSTSFDNIPKAIPGGTGTAAAPVGGQPVPVTAPVAAANKPAPIRAGLTAPNSRVDPFISRLIEPFERRPAYEFVATARLAGRPVPPRPPKNENPDLQFGPLPFVQRRVAGVLYDGQVSAILETGGVGTGTTQVVQPGAAVPSGIPGIDDLIVDTITPTSLTLRARDGRTTSVALSGAPDGTLTGLTGGGAGAPPPVANQGGRGGPGGAAEAVQ